MFLVKYIRRCFPLFFDGIANGIVASVPLSDSALLVYTNAADFWAFVLCPATLLGSSASAPGVPVGPRGLSASVACPHQGRPPRRRPFRGCVHVLRPGSPESLSPGAGSDRGGVSSRSDGRLSRLCHGGPAGPWGSCCSPRGQLVLKPQGGPGCTGVEGLPSGAAPQCRALGPALCSGRRRGSLWGSGTPSLCEGRPSGGGWATGGPTRAFPRA